MRRRECKFTCVSCQLEAPISLGLVFNCLLCSHGSQKSPLKRRTISSMTQVYFCGTYSFHLTSPQALGTHPRILQPYVRRQLLLPREYHFVRSSHWHYFSENALDSSQESISPSASQNMRCFHRLLHTWVQRCIFPVVLHLLYCFVVDHSRQSCERIHKVGFPRSPKNQHLTIQDTQWLFLRIPMALSFSFVQGCCILALCGYNPDALHLSLFLKNSSYWKNAHRLVIPFVRLRPKSTPSYSQFFPLIICRIRVCALQCWYCIHPIVLVSYLHLVDLSFFESSLIISFFVSLFGSDRANNEECWVEYMHAKRQARTGSSIMLNGMLIAEMTRFRCRKKLSES